MLLPVALWFMINRLVVEVSIALVLSSSTFACLQLRQLRELRKMLSGEQALSLRCCIAPAQLCKMTLIHNFGACMTASVANGLHVNQQKRHSKADEKQQYVKSHG